MEPILGLMQGLAWGKLNRRKFILYLNVFLPLKLKPVKTCDNIGVIEARCPHSTRPGRPQSTSSGCQGSTSPWRRCERLNTQTFGKFVPTHVFFTHQGSSGSRRSSFVRPNSDGACRSKWMQMHCNETSRLIIQPTMLEA